MPACPTSPTRSVESITPTLIHALHAHAVDSCELHPLNPNFSTFTMSSWTGYTHETPNFTRESSVNIFYRMKMVGHKHPRAYLASASILIRSTAQVDYNGKTVFGSIPLTISSQIAHDHTRDVTHTRVPKLYLAIPQKQFRTIPIKQEHEQLRTDTLAPDF